MGFYIIFLQNSAGIGAHCSQQVLEMWVLLGFLMDFAAVPHYLRVPVV
jgi:hypothetical protein